MFATNWNFDGVKLPILLDYKIARLTLQERYLVTVNNENMWARSSSCGWCRNFKPTIKLRSVSRILTRLHFVNHCIEGCYTSELRKKSCGKMSTRILELGQYAPLPKFCAIGAKCLLALFSSSLSRSGLDFIGNIFHLVTL